MRRLIEPAPPFPRDQGLAVIHAHLSTPPPQVSAVRAGVPGAADAVLIRALAKSPQDRYPACGDFSDALRAALGIAPYRAGPRRASHPQTEIADLAQPPAATDLTVGVLAPIADSRAATAAGSPGGWIPGFPVPDQPGRVPRGPGHRPGARWPYVLISAAAVTAAVVAVTIVVTKGPGITTPGTAGRSSAPAAPASSAPGANRTQPPASSAPAQLGWSTYQDPSGFSVGLPPDWARDSATRTGTYPSVDFTGPTPGFHLVISWSRKTGTRALPAWQQLAASFARKYPAYQVIQLRQVSYRNYNTAVWEFTNIKDGVLTHVIDLGIVVKPGIEGYAIELYGPQANWPAIYQSMWTQVLATFQPAPR